MSNDGGSSHVEEEEDIANLFDVVISDPSPADKRAHHNALERKRRDLIKDSFHSLLLCVPNITDSKASRAQILKKATNYIVLMKEKIGKFQEDIGSMKDQHKTQEQQVIALEKIKATSTFAQTSGFIKPNSISPEPTGGLKRKEPADADNTEESPIKKRLRNST